MTHKGVGVWHKQLLREPSACNFDELRVTTCSGEYIRISPFIKNRINLDEIALKFACFDTYLVAEAYTNRAGPALEAAPSEESIFKRLIL